MVGLHGHEATHDGVVDGDAEVREDGIAVTFEYGNPNDGAMNVESAFREGTTADAPPQELRAGTETFTVLWTPDGEDERLVWAVDASAFGPEEPITAETPTAGELDPERFETDDADGLPGGGPPDDATGDGNGSDAGADEDGTGGGVGTGDSFEDDRVGDENESDPGAA